MTSAEARAASAISGAPIDWSKVTLTDADIMQGLWESGGGVTGPTGSLVFITDYGYGSSVPGKYTPGGDARYDAYVPPVAAVRQDQARTAIPGATQPVVTPFGTTGTAVPPTAVPPVNASPEIVVATAAAADSKKLLWVVVIGFFLLSRFGA